jgi:hypothetical protein
MFDRNCGDVNTLKLSIDSTRLLLRCILIARSVDVIFNASSCTSRYVYDMLQLKFKMFSSNDLLIIAVTPKHFERMPSCFPFF